MSKYNKGPWVVGSEAEGYGECEGIRVYGRDDDYVHRISTGRAYLDSRTKLWRRHELRFAAVLVALVIIVALSIVAFARPAGAQIIDTKKPGPVCVDYGTGVYSCEGY